MHILLRPKHLVAVLAGFVALLNALPADAQRATGLSIGGDYTFIRTNVIPGCNCVGLQGASAEAQYAFGSHLAALADATVAHRGGITPDHYALTQFTYTFGVRYWPTTPKRHVLPFADLTLGGAHAFGTLSPANTVAGASSNAFALNVGGGVQVTVGHRVTLQPIQAGYLMTTFANGVANRQNDLRVSTGLLFRLSR